MVLQEPYHLLTVQLIDVSNVFMLQPQFKHQMKVRRKVQLPFGLQKLHRRKRRRVSRRKDKVASCAVVKEPSGASHVCNDSDTSGSSSTSCISCSGNSSNESGSSSSSSSSRTSSSKSSRSSSGHPSHVTPNDEVFHATLNNGHDTVHNVHMNVPEPDLLNESLVLPSSIVHTELAEVETAAKEDNIVQQRRIEASKTFFGNSLGLCNIDFAVSGRSICGICCTPILKGTPRFAYFWNRLRPSKWMHASCLPRWCFQDDGLKSQAVSYLMDQQETIADTPLKNIIEEALRTLQPWR